MALREFTLPSGVKAGIDVAPFADSKRLYSAIAGELRHVEIKAGSDVAELVKNIVCIVSDSPKIEAALEVCLKRCTYNGAKVILPDTFEPVSAREDYLDFCSEVIKDNIGPFTKSLSVQFASILGAVDALQKSI